MYKKDSEHENASQAQQTSSSLGTPQHDHANQQALLAASKEYDAEIEILRKYYRREMRQRIDEAPRNDEIAIQEQKLILIEGLKKIEENQRDISTFPVFCIFFLDLANSIGLGILLQKDMTSILIVGVWLWCATLFYPAYWFLRDIYRLAGRC